MPPQGCDLAAPGDKLYSSVTRKTYRQQPGCANFFLGPNLAIKINTTNGNFTPLCFLVLFRRLQSKIAQIQTVKIFWPSNIPSSRVASFCMSCSVHEKYSNLTGIPWKPGTGTSFFTVHLTGVTRNLQAVRYIFSFFSCDKKFIKVNVKPTFYCSLL